MNTLLVTVDSLRYNHLDQLEQTREFLPTWHDRAFSTSTATLGSFPAIVGGEYPDGTGLHEGTSVANHLSGHRIGITTDHPLSESYGYDEGFDVLSSPKGGGDSLKDRVAVYLTGGTLSHRIASWGWSQYQRVTSLYTDVPKSFRPAGAIVGQFLDSVEGHDEWFGWLHFMEPHHPYDPDGADVSRTKAQRATRRVLSGNGNEDDRELVRELYREEIHELDEELARLWDSVPDDTRVVFCADHGVLLGEDGLWGHTGEMREELLHVPFGTRNAPELGDVVSLIDLPAMLRGEPHGRGVLDRDVALSTYGKDRAATNRNHITSDDGMVEIATVKTVSDSQLKCQLDRFEAGGVVKEDALLEDLKELSYV